MDENAFDDFIEYIREEGVDMVKDVFVSGNYTEAQKVIVLTEMAFSIYCVKREILQGIAEKARE